EKNLDKGHPTEFTADAGSGQAIIILESLSDPPKPAAKPEPPPEKTETDVMQGKRWVVKSPDTLELVGPAGAVGPPVKVPRFRLARLPADAAEAARGWATSESAGQTYRYRLLPPVKAGQCAVEAVRESPLDAACGVTIKEIFTWDTERGLPEAMQLDVAYA